MLQLFCQMSASDVPFFFVNFIILCQGKRIFFISLYYIIYDDFIIIMLDYSLDKDSEYGCLYYTLSHRRFAADFGKLWVTQNEINAALKFTWP